MPTDRDKSPLNVLMVSNFYPPFVVGGAELVAYHLASWLAGAGVNVTVISSCGPESGESEEQIDGVRVIRFFPKNLWWNFERFTPGDTRSVSGKLLWNLKDIWNTAAAARFGELLNEVRPDIVHTHNIKGFSPAIWGEITKRGIPFVHTTHDYHLICQRGTMLNSKGRMCGSQCGTCAVGTRVSSTSARRSELICSPSQFVLDRHAEFGVTGRLGSVVVPNGVPGTPIVRSSRTAGEPLQLLFIGQLRVEKGAHLLSQVLGYLDKNIRLSVAGEGPLSPEIARLAAGDSRVTVHGFVRGEQKERLFARADALLFPSTWSENAPLVISEAMMAGLPVIGSNIGAIPEFVRPELNGLLFDVNDASSLAASIQRLQLEDGLLARLSQGASRSAEGWTLRAMGSSYLSVYQSVGTRCFEPSLAAAQ